MTEMSKIEVPYVQALKDRHGHQRYYFRRAGYPRVTLPGEPGSVQFAKAYEAALRTERKKPVSPTESARSIGALIAEYYLSPEFKALAPLTQKTYRNVLEQFRNEYGKHLAINFTPVNLNVIFHKMGDTPAQAASRRKRLRAVFELGVTLGWIKTNPVTLTKRIKYKTKGFPPWTENEIDQFKSHWKPGTRPRRALELLLCTGVRRVDVVTLGRQHVRDGRISVVQEKTDERIALKIHPDLQREIDLAEGMTFLLTEYGKPFTDKGFTKWFVAQARAAGVVDRTPHGLRKAAGRRLAEAGCSEHEIAAVLGHANPQSSAVYTKDANRARLAEGAADKLEKAERRTKA